MTEIARGVEAPFLFLRMQPSWVVVDHIRRFVQAFCASACPSTARDEQIAIATHELVQNAISNAAAPDIEVKLHVDPATQRVYLSVTNVARPDQIDVLRERLQRALANPDPLKGYVTAMRDDPHSRGGIGLARVRFEGALELAMEVDGEKVTVHAEGPLADPPRLAS